MFWFLHFFWNFWELRFTENFTLIYTREDILHIIIIAYIILHLFSFSSLTYQYCNTTFFFEILAQFNFPFAFVWNERGCNIYLYICSIAICDCGKCSQQWTWAHSSNGLSFFFYFSHHHCLFYNPFSPPVSHFPFPLKL